MWYFFVALLIIILNTFMIYMYFFFEKAHSFFNDKNFPTIKPKFIVGNFKDVITMKKPLGLCIYDLHKQLEPNKFGGIYMLNRPAVLIRDPELIKNIFIRDFDYFRDRGLEFKQGEEPLHHNLLRISGEEWKNTRMKLNPFFTLSRTKAMFSSLQQCANRFEQILNKTNGESFDIKEMSEQYTIDVIGNCAFGIDFSAMNDPNCLIRRMAKRIFQFKFQTIFRHAIPHPPKFLLKIFNLSYADREVEDFFSSMMIKAINIRKRSQTVRTSLIDLLLHEKDKNILDNVISEQNEAVVEKKHIETNNETEESTMEFRIAQCYLFFAAGFETSSSTLAYCMLELALNQSIQNKVRKEIIETLGKYDNQINYNSVKEMTYTDMVIAETLRKHPPAAISPRKSTKPYQIPDSKAIIPENMFILISVYGLHMDPKYYEKPDQFYPEHFTKEAKSSRPMCAYIPFGEGPRGCIGERLAKLEIKLAVVNMIKNFVFEISPKMKFPLEYNYDMKLGLLVPRNGIWLRCKKYQD